MFFMKINNSHHKLKVKKIPLNNKDYNRMIYMDRYKKVEKLY